jgi:hypothetical protein
MASREIRYVTVYLFPSNDKKSPVRANAAPELLTVRAGDIIDFTVVDAAGVGGTVTFEWDERGNPLKDEYKPFPRSVRLRVRRGAKGRFKYSILLNGRKVFDPEIEVVH